MSTENSSLLVLSINHETVPLDEREQYSVDDSRVSDLYSALKQQTEVQESLILNTCNRFELYALINSETQNDSSIIDAVALFYQLDSDQVRKHSKLRFGQDSVQHLIEVSAGLRSQITGEAEIFGQVKSAYSLATKLNGAGKVLNRVFQKGFQAAKLIRHSTQIGEGKINISNVAVDLSTKIFGKLSETSALVIGTGEIGEKTAKALKSRGARNFAVASRNVERARDVASQWGGEPIPIESISDQLFEYDIVISSTITEQAIISQAMVKQALAKRKERPLFLIDLGMPRNIEKSCEQLECVFVYNLDDLAEIAAENLKDRQKAVDSCLEISRSKATAIWQNLVNRSLVKD